MNILTLFRAMEKSRALINHEKPRLAYGGGYRGGSETIYRHATIFVNSGIGKQIAVFNRCDWHRGERIGVYRTAIRNIATGRLHVTEHYYALRRDRFKKVRRSKHLS